MAKEDKKYVIALVYKGDIIDKSKKQFSMATISKIGANNIRDTFKIYGLDELEVTVITVDTEKD